MNFVHGLGEEVPDAGSGAVINATGADLDDAGTSPALVGLLPPNIPRAVASVRAVSTYSNALEAVFLNTQG